MSRARNEEKRLEILAIAYDLFLEKGFENVKLTEIANAAGISPQLLRHFFGTTHDILVELVYNVSSRAFEFVASHEKLFDGVSDKDAPFVVIDVLYRLHYAVICQDPALFALYRSVMYDSRVKKREVEQIIVGMRKSFHGRFVGDAEWENGLHVACSAQSALVLRYAPEGLPTVPVDVILDGAMRAFCGYMQVGPDRCASALDAARAIVTDEVAEEYKSYFYANIRNFFLMP